MANYDTVPTTASLGYISHSIQDFDTHAPLDKCHGPLSPRIGVAESKIVSIKDGKSHSTHGTVAETGSSSAGNDPEILPSKDIAVANTTPELIEASNASNVSITGVEDLQPATEPVEVFRFQGLASEVRNRIYHFVLGPPQDPSICLTQVLHDRSLKAPNKDVDLDNSFRTKSVKINPEHEDPDWGVIHEAKPIDLSILLVSKQIYTEAFHVFYTTNCFSFTDTGLLYRFLKNIGYNRRQHLTMLYFLWRGPDAKEAFRLLKTCRRLRVVEFTVPCSHPPGYEALKEVRVEKARARALIHFAPAQNPPLNIHDHTSCFGDYQCHCICRRPYEPASNLRELEKAMMRPRREHDLPDPNEKFDLFKPKRESFKISEEQELLQGKASFDDFIGRIEQQGKELKYLGRRNKTMEATLNQTLIGSDVEDYFRDFAEKLAEDKRQIKKREYWTAKIQAEKEAKEKEERLKQEYVEAKKLEKQKRWDARELKWKIAREARDHAKQMAREAREFKRIAREAREREKMIARDARAQIKAAKKAKERDKKTCKGKSSVGKTVVSPSKEL